MPSRREIKDADEERDDRAEEDEDDRPSSGRRKFKPLSGGRSRGQRLKAWFRDARLDLYFLFLIGSIVLFLMGYLSVFSPRAFGPGLESWFRSLGGANVYLFVAGLVTILTSGYLFGGLMVKRREFERLVKTRAKSDFIRNLDRVERLAFELGTKESQMVADKKKEFKVRH